MTGFAKCIPGGLQSGTRNMGHYACPSLLFSVTPSVDTIKQCRNVEKSSESLHLEEDWANGELNWMESAADSFRNQRCMSLPTVSKRCPPQCELSPLKIWWYHQQMLPSCCPFPGRYILSTLIAYSYYGVLKLPKIHFREGCKTPETYHYLVEEIKTRNLLHDWMIWTYLPTSRWWAGKHAFQQAVFQQAVFYCALVGFIIGCNIEKRVVLIAFDSPSHR